VIGRQMLRSGTSVAANYRAVCRVRSRAEFVAKIGTVVEEADETVFWLELLVESEVLSMGPHRRFAQGSKRTAGDICCFPAHS
jgi:four helix bundle protein